MDINWSLAPVSSYSAAERSPCTHRAGGAVAYTCSGVGLFSKRWPQLQEQPRAPQWTRGLHHVGAVEPPRPPHPHSVP